MLPALEGLILLPQFNSTRLQKEGNSRRGVGAWSSLKAVSILQFPGLLVCALVLLMSSNESTLLCLQLQKVSKGTQHWLCR